MPITGHCSSIRSVHQDVLFGCRMILPVILFCLSVLLIWYLGSRKPKGFPPGPKWWPVVGSALEVARLRKDTGFLYETFTTLSRAYGPVVGLKIGTDRIVVLNDLQSMRSLMANEDCDGRPNGLMFETRTWGVRRGLITTDGTLWAENRRFVLRHLKEFGFGRTTMASLIEKEAWHLVQYFKQLLKAGNSRVAVNKATATRCKDNCQLYQLAAQNEDSNGKSNKYQNHETNNAIANNKTLKLEDLYMKAEDYDDVRKVSQSCAMIISMHDAFGVSVLNTLWKMMAGRRYNNDDKELLHLQSILDKVIKDVDMMGCLFSYFPILRYIAPELSGYTKFVHTHHQLWVFLNEELQNHKLTFNPDKPRDLIDAYISILQSESKTASFSEPQLLATCMDMFMAGSETTSKALGFCFLYMVLCPDVQKKAQEEIDTIVGNQRSPALSDRARMPYIDAIVLESVRMFMGRTMNVPHRALKDTTILGYQIPKDTVIIGNFNRVLMDESWGDPEVFRPERFINDEGKVKIPERFFPFSFGKHRCIGEALAKGNIFMMTAALLQIFTFSVVPGENKPSTDIIDGATCSPTPFRALVTVRECT